jgi:hypothetical protein
MMRGNGNLAALLDRFISGRYVGRPVVSNDLDDEDTESKVKSKIPWKSALVIVLIAGIVALVIS